MMPESWMYTSRREDLPVALRAELGELLDKHGVCWHVAGPGPDGSWYAWPRNDDRVPRVLASSLAELADKLDDQESGS